MKNTQSSALYLLLLLSCAASGAEQIFKHVDENGKVTYSNSPIKGGKKVELPPISTVTLPKETPKVEAPKSTASKTDSPPVVEADKATRKRQLLEAIANEEKALEIARVKVSEGDVPELSRKTKTVPGKDGKSTTLTEIRDDPNAYEDKMKKLNSEVTAREKKLLELKLELGRLDDKL